MLYICVALEVGMKILTRRYKTYLKFMLFVLIIRFEVLLIFWGQKGTNKFTQFGNLTLVLMLQNQTPINNQFYNCKSVNFNFQIRAIHAVDERTLADEMSSLITAEQILWCWPPAAHSYCSRYPNFVLLIC